VNDTVTGLEGGAHVYVTKPFRFEELLARVRVRLRDSGKSEPTILRAGDVSLDLRARRATVGHQCGYLRKKLGDGVIETVRGMGYRPRS